MIPLSAQVPRKLAAAIGISFSGSHALKRLANLAEIAASHSRIEGGGFGLSQRAKIILQMLAPQQPGHRGVGAFGSGRRFLGAHRLPDGRGIPLEIKPPQRGVKLESQSTPRRGIDGGKRCARQGFRVLGIEDLRQGPFQRSRSPRAGAVRRRARAPPRKSGSSRPYQRIERYTEGCAATKASPRATNISSPSSACRMG